MLENCADTKNSLAISLSSDNACERVCSANSNCCDLIGNKNLNPLLLQSDMESSRKFWTHSCSFALRLQYLHTFYVIPAKAGIQGVETAPGFRVFARNENAVNSRMEEIKYTPFPYGTSQIWPIPYRWMRNEFASNRFLQWEWV